MEVSELLSWKVLLVVLSRAPSSQRFARLYGSSLEKLATHCYTIPHHFTSISSCASLPRRPPRPTPTSSAPPTSTHSATMCTSSATLFYGVCVKAMSLLVAARAWPDIEPVYLAVDLIRARRRRGDLRVEVSAGTKTVADLPDEIWEAVKVELSSDIFVEAADSFVRSYHRDPDCDCRSCLAASSGVLDIWYLAGCDACIDDFLHSGGLRDWYAKEKEVRSHVGSRSSLIADALRDPAEYRSRIASIQAHPRST